MLLMKIRYERITSKNFRYDTSPRENEEWGKDSPMSEHYMIDPEKPEKIMKDHLKN